MLKPVIMKKILFVCSSVLLTLLLGCASPSNQHGMVEKDDGIAGIVTVPSNNSVDQTYQNLKTAIKEKEALSIIAELDHRQNAASVDMELRPTRILMFGNPTLGTPLMQASQSTGLDLPQKMLVYENADGQVFIGYNDPAYLKERHDIEGQDENLKKISKALKNLAEKAAQ